MKINQAQALQSFLNRYTLLWNDEIMNTYPQSIEHYPKEWLELLDSLSASELYAIDCKEIPVEIQGTTFAHFMTSLVELSTLPKIAPASEAAIEDWAYYGVKEKKRHEIKHIIPTIKKLQKSHPFEYVIDIGGGVGHLARVLAHYYAIPTLSLDRNQDFQKIGKARLTKYRLLPDSQPVTFINMNFGLGADRNLLKTVFTKNALTLGLHTCGPLAHAVINHSIDHETIGLLSFGCCYHHLNPETDLFLSNYYRDNHFFPLNLYALSLATRSHAAMSLTTYQTKERVKYYRYALHLFLMRHFNSSYFTDVGECHIRTYWEPFPRYIRSKLRDLNLNHSFSDFDFQNFYDDPSIQKELRVMFLCNIIRWQLGRALEVYLLLDRCLYLEERGYSVKIEEYFKEALSPRNIGILALKA